MKNLHKGDRGPDVLALQKSLITAGYRLKPDAHFGDNTDIALRSYQNKKGLLPDGIAGPDTCKVLACTDKPNVALSSPMFNRLIALLGGTVMGAAMRAQHNPQSQNQGSLHPVHLHTSENGLKFIFTGEAQPGVSNVLHWPGGSSGVTLGPGYDMGGRTALKISVDLQKVGVPKVAAEKAAEAAGLKGVQAAQFVKNNNGLIKLKDEEQEFALLRRIVPGYEKMVQSAITIDLFQHQFDALVSFAYNPSGRFRRVTGLINQGEVKEALQLINGANTSGGMEMKGLTNRRKREVALYLYNDYGALRHI